MDRISWHRRQHAALDEARRAGAGERRKFADPRAFEQSGTNPGPARKRFGGCWTAARREIVEREHEANEVTREVLLAVRRTFITPFDRGDFKDLIRAMDNAIDQMQQAAKTITIYKVRTFEPAMQEIGGIIVTAANLTREAVPLLR